MSSVTDSKQGAREASPPSRPQATPSGGSRSTERKAGLSCAECRRSKLKCDRAIPCSACIRRGCSAICPNGTLTATKGDQALRVKAKRLEGKVETLTAKIKELEATLREARQPSRTTSDAGPSSAPEEVSDGINEPSNRLLEAVGSLAINEDGVARYFGSTSTCEYLSSLLPQSDGAEQIARSLRDPKNLGLPSELLELVYAFPFGMQNCSYNISIFARFLPPRDVAYELAEAYWTYAAWLYTPLMRDDFYETIFGSIYKPKDPTVTNVRPHQLSIFYAILATGLIWSDDTSAHYVCAHYDALARAAFSLQPITISVTCWTCQALFCIYRLLNNVCRTSAEEWWLLHGLNVRICQMIALQYDGSAFGLEERELQRRRLTFWELYVWDTWNGFSLGRIPSLKLEFTDCAFPTNDEGPEQIPGELGFHAWKYRYTTACLPESLRQALRPGNMSYAGLLELDRKIRTFPVPSRLKFDLRNTERSGSVDLATALQQCTCTLLKETNLLYLHRSYFAMAIDSEPVNPLSHPYAASVIATYRSACRICLAVKRVYLHHPRAVRRTWYFWSQVFSSCVAIAALVLGAPNCSLAQEALIEMNSAITFYEEGSSACRPEKTMQILATLRKRAQEFYASCRSKSVIGSDCSPAFGSEDLDKFNILSGRIGVIRHKSEPPVHSLPVTSTQEIGTYTPPPPSHMLSPFHEQFSFQPLITHGSEQLASFERYVSSFNDGHVMAPHPPSSSSASHFPSFSTTTPVLQTGYSQLPNLMHAYDMMDGPVAHATDQLQQQPAYSTDTTRDVRRDVWSSFIDRLMAYPEPHPRI